MSCNVSSFGPGRFLATSLTLWVSTLSLIGAEVTITRTNLAERWITNVIEVRMPVNRFVNEYRTNWITQLRTNAVDMYVTNHVTAYQTNWNLLNLTNWLTVVLFKTNWFTQALTNVVQIDLPNPPVVAATSPTETVESNAAPLQAASPGPAVIWAGPLAIEAARTSRAPANDLVEVQMKIRRTDNSASPPQVQQWRVEREDGAILLFGQDQDFKRGLPAGNYKVEARLKVEGDNPPLSVRGLLSVTTREAVVQPRLLVKR